MKNNIFLSIIIPVYNVEKYIERCIESIESQNFSDYEIILLDDGSTDNSLNICYKLSEKYKNIVVNTHENCGLGFTRNIGITLSNGKYIWFVDSDDYISSNCINELYEVSKKYNYPDLITFGWNIVDKNNVIIKSNYPENNYNVLINHETIINDIIPDFIYGKNGHESGLHMSSSRSLFKRSVLLENNLRFVSEREWISEDYYFYISNLKSFKNLVMINKPFYNYCQNSNSLTTSYRKDRFEKLIKFYKKMDEIIDNNCYSSECYERINGLFISNMIACIKMECCNSINVGFINSYNRLKTILKNSYVKSKIINYTTDKLSWKIFIVLNRCKMYLIIYLLCLYQSHKDNRKRS